METQPIPTATAPDDAVMSMAQTPAFPAREKRLTTILLMGKLISGAGESLCRVRNLSSGGLMAETHAALTTGDGVRIELKTGLVLAGEVRWSRGGRIGIAFDAPIDVNAVLERTSRKLKGPERPRAPRFSVDCDAVLRGDGRRRTARLVNLSQGGAQLQVDFDMAAGQVLDVAVDGLPERRGAVRWVQGEAVGVSFIEPLAFEALGRWLCQAAPSV